MFTCIHTHTNAHTHLYTYVHRCARTCIHKYNTNTYTHTHTQTHSHTPIHPFTPLPTGVEPCQENPSFRQSMHGSIAPLSLQTDTAKLTVLSSEMTMIHFITTSHQPNVTNINPYFQTFFSCGVIK